MNQHSEMDENQELLRLRLPADPAYVCVAREAALAQAERAGLIGERRENVSLAVGEACNNAALHSGRPGTFVMRCLLDGDDFVVEITSEGGAPLPDTPASMPDTTSESGRGRALMAALVDTVDYETIPGGLRVRLVQGVRSLGR